MPTDVIMPQLGETVTEGTVSTWHKRVGDPIAEGETLFDVSTDKVDTEIPAPTAGILTQIFVEAGMTVGVGTRLAAIEPAGGAKSPAPAKAMPAAPPAPAPSAIAPRNSNAALPDRLPAT